MGDEDKQKIKNVMKNYRRMDSNTIKIFKEYGLVVRKDKKHFKIYRSDSVGHGKCVVLAKTPSDVRAALNVCRYLFELIDDVA